MNQLPWAIISNTLTLIPKLLVGLLAAALGGLSVKDVFRSTVKTHLEEVVKEAESDAQESLVAQVFWWLAEHPLSDRARRIVVFTAFAILSLGDLFTS